MCAQADMCVAPIVLTWVAIDTHITGITQEGPIFLINLQPRTLYAQMIMIWKQ